MEKLKGVLVEGLFVSFRHVRRQGNKVVNQMAILGTKTHRDVKAKEWSEVTDETG